MCVQLRPVIKDDSILQAVFKVCLKYTSTQKWDWPGTRIARWNGTPLHNASLVGRSPLWGAVLFPRDHHSMKNDPVSPCGTRSM